MLDVILLKEKEINCLYLANNKNSQNEYKACVASTYSTNLHRTKDERRESGNANSLPGLT